MLCMHDQSARRSHDCSELEFILENGIPVMPYSTVPYQSQYTGITGINDKVPYNVLAVYGLPHFGYMYVH